ncbi:MAG: 30S ribosomal protein S17e [Desulfurococcales archaeon]|nr:30S ribosomal protein S17e [Desulfurococcales archaeon]
MGKVRPSLVKRTARTLLELYPSEASDDFERNKELVNQYVHLKSKKLRNQIAGYLTHLVKLQRREEEAVQE